ncbi:MAG: tetratricopeptide repeat protein, partial [Muribaculaceae bacterium]|nr:tetratricopeptide repeat protein [Muribaculaceae bacterium]
MLKKFIIALAACAFLTPAVAQKGIDNPVTKAVLGVYDRQLKADPNDFNTWFRRANEYYRHNEYIRALADINEALRCTPASDKDLRFQEYMLRAGIYNQTGRHQEALADLNSAVMLDGSSYHAIYQRANTQFELGMYSEAKTDYQRLQRLNSRSLESILGLARVAVKENNLGLAGDYLEQAVSLDVNNPEIYIRRASVRKMMGDHNGAVEDLIVALSIDSKNNKALEALVDYGNTNYVATINGLTNAIRQAPNVGMFRYIRAVIAQAHYNYLSAIDDYRYIIDNRLYNYPGLNASIAECEFHLGHFDEALDEINYVLGTPGATNNSNYFLLKSKILRATGRNAEAVEAAAMALAISPNSAEALSQMGLSYLSDGKVKEAVNLCNEASMTESSDPYQYMLRAWIQNDYLDNSQLATNLYDQALDIDVYDLDNIRSLRGFALLFTDRMPQAEAWINNILTNVPDNDGYINYLAACYYAHAGNHDLALA